MDPKPPTVVTVIGWAWFAIGLLMIVSGGMALILSTIMNQFIPGGFPPPNLKIPPQFAPMIGIFQHFGVLAAIQLVLAGLIVYTASNFLKLQEWARKGLMVVSVLAATYIISFSIFWIYMWISMTSMPETNSQSAPPLGFKIFGVVAGSVNMVLFSVPPILSIIALRGKTVRDAIAARQAQST